MGEQRAVRLENLASMQNKLINCDNNYVKLDDDIVMEGLVTVKCNNTQELKQQYLILLRHCMLFAFPKHDEKMSFEREIRLKDYRAVTDIEDGSFYLDLNDGESILLAPAAGTSDAVAMAAW